MAKLPKQVCKVYNIVLGTPPGGVDTDPKPKVRELTSCESPRAEEEDRAVYSGPLPSGHSLPGSVGCGRSSDRCGCHQRQLREDARSGVPPPLSSNHRQKGHPQAQATAGTGRQIPEDLTLKGPVGYPLTVHLCTPTGRVHPAEVSFSGVELRARGGCARCSVKGLALGWGFHGNVRDRVDEGFRL